MSKVVTKVNQQHQDKLIIFDDDPYFGALIAASARNFGFRPNFFTSLYAMGPFSRLKEYDLAIIDVYMDSIRGDELAAYIDMFLMQVPVILVSAEPLDLGSQDINWPPSVRAFVHKSLGPYRILKVARATLERERLLRRLSMNETRIAVNALDQVSPGSIA